LVIHCTKNCAARAGTSLVYGVSKNATTVDIQYQASATAEQIAWAEQAKQTFDWRPRRFLSDSTIASAYAGLTTQQQNAILRRLVALLIRNNESAVLQIFSDLGQSLPYDEVAP
jgi:ABC-type taurine transport system substrate-binding protein